VCRKRSWWAKAQLAQEALTYTNWNSRIMMAIFLLKSREEIEPLLVQQDQNTEKISALGKQLREQIESEKERELLDAVDAARWPFVDSYKQALHLHIDEQKPAQAGAAMVKATLPLLKNYHSAWNAFVQFQGDQMNQELESELAQRKRTEGQLWLQAAALESAIYAIIIMDRSGSVIWANPAFTAITGYSADELPGQNSRMLCFPQQPQSFYENIWKTILAGQVWHGKITNRRKDGRLYTEEQTIIPMRNDRGEITHFVVIVLAFSRMQVLQPKILDLNSIVHETGRMLPRLLGEDIEFAFKPDPALGYVKADSGQIEQIIMNLAVNARESMPEGGRLTVETANVVLDEEYAHTHPPIVAGRYVMLAVSDTGVGMDKEMQTDIFEPFRTTKGQGQGTGLALATINGVVKQSGGFICVESEPGQGAAFKIYLPQVDNRVETAGPGRVASGRLGGTETVLLVEDEEDVKRQPS
jgi:PAS domain S-box-containing protein